MKKKKFIKYREVVSASDKEIMLAVLIRNAEVFELFKDTLEHADFSEADFANAAIWQIIKKYHADFGQLPMCGILTACLRTEIENNPGLLPDEGIEEAEALIETAFDDIGRWKTDLSTSQEYAEWAITTVKRFHAERMAAKVHKNTIPRMQVLEDLPGFLEASRQATEEVAAIGVSATGSLFPKGWDKSGGINVFSTGLTFLDTFLAGGHAPKEVYGVLGPFGSCKTTLAVMLVVEACRQAHQHFMETDEMQYVFLVSYEASQQELRNRVLSYAAQIRRTSLETMDDQGLAALSTAKNLRSYEEELFQTALQAGNKILGERGRVKRAIKWLKKHLIVLDMSGGDENRRGAGGGYIAEIAMTIKSELRGRGPDAKCRLVVIDYVGAMVKRHLATANKDLEELRHLITGAPLTAKTQIAVKYDCPVWMMHQISGKANEKSPGAQYHHTDAAESKSFGENVDFSFSLGKPNAAGLCQILATKHRRTKELPAQIIQIDGEMCTVVDAGDNYVLDPCSHHFTAKNNDACFAWPTNMHIAESLTQDDDHAHGDDLKSDA